MLEPATETLVRSDFSERESQMVNAVRLFPVEVGQIFLP
jgi:hypothetical protein